MELLKKMTRPHKSDSFLTEEREKLIKTVFIYSQNNKSIRPNSLYPRYMIYRYDITDPHKFHIRMINEGYFEKANTMELLKTLKVSNLKEMLKKNGFKTTGKKEELVLRITDNLDISYINAFFKGDRQIFTLSEKGKQWLNSNHIYVDFHNKAEKWDISFDEFVKFEREFRFQATFNDIAWAIFNARKLQCELYEDNPIELRSTLLFMSKLLEEEHRNSDSLKYLLSVFWMDISGVIELGKRRYYSESELREKLHANPGYTFLFAPGIIRRIIGSKELVKNYEIDLRFLSPTTIRSCCSYDLFCSILYDLCSNSFFNKESYYNALIDDFILRK